VRLRGIGTCFGPSWPVGGGRIELQIVRRLLVLVLAVLVASVLLVTLAAVAAADPPGPTASFTHEPASPLPGEAVTLTSTSAPGEGHAIALPTWDLDNDGDFDDDVGIGRRSFASPGRFRVRLRVVDNHGQADVATSEVVVGNQTPSASFTYRPQVPLVGETISLFSTSTDPDSPIESHLWDLDGDGSFDDASGPVASLSFPLDGSFSVGLQVLDGEGSSAIAFETVVVGGRLPAGARATTQGAVRVLSPFPVVRIAGSIKRGGTRIRRFTVTAPVGATVTIRCRGRGCPFGRQRRTAVGRPMPWAPSVRLIHVRRLERRLIRVGVIIKVFVTRPGAVGKFTEFRIRRRTVPARTDACLEPGGAIPVPCPAL
jgi:hypothetical protein